MNTWPCPKLDFPRHPFGAPMDPCAQSECPVHFAHTFSIGTPCMTGLRGCFKGLVQTINTWPCPSWISPGTPSGHGLWPHLLYGNSMRDQSEGLFRGLSLNPKYMALSKVEPPQSECIARFACTFSIGTPCVTSPRGCSKGLVRVHRLLRSHLLYWNSMHNQSKGCFEGLV